MNFSCVGFDVREWPWGGPLNADETGWERNERRYSELVGAFGLWQNEYQVLEINSERIAEIATLVSSWPDCNLLAVEYPTDIVLLRDLKLGFHTAAASVDLAGFVCRGLDVCDFNGLFSVLHHPEITSKRGGTNLFNSGEFLPALELVQYANVLDPNHAPFAVAKLWSLK